MLGSTTSMTMKLGAPRYARDHWTPSWLGLMCVTPSFLLQSAATPKMLVRAGSVRRNLTPVAAEVARTRVEELTDSPVARGAGSGVGAGAGTQPPKSSSLRSLTATPLSAKGSTAWDAASVHSMFAEFDPSDRAVPAAVIDHGSAYVCVAHCAVSQRVCRD